MPIASGPLTESPEDYAAAVLLNRRKSLLFTSASNPLPDYFLSAGQVG